MVFLVIRLPHILQLQICIAAWSSALSLAFIKAKTVTTADFVRHLQPSSLLLPFIQLIFCHLLSLSNGYFGAINMSLFCADHTQRKIILLYFFPPEFFLQLFWTLNCIPQALNREVHAFTVTKLTLGSDRLIRFAPLSSRNRLQGNGQLSRLQVLLLQSLNQREKHQRNNPKNP